MSEQTPRKVSKGPVILPLFLVVVAGLLLLSNFLLLGDFNIVDLWPLLLVVIGAYMLVRGDFVVSDDSYQFRLTRGSVESATVEINSGEIDVYIGAAPKGNPDRLILGQYAPQSRPALDVEEDNHANLRFARHQTPWLSFADWDLSLSRDLPWQIVASTYVGQVTADMSNLIIQNALFATGMSDIQVVLPREAFETIYARSLAGTIKVTVPSGIHARITIEGGRFFGVSLDENRFNEVEPGVFVTRNTYNLPTVDVVVSGTFGDAFIS